METSGGASPTPEDAATALWEASAARDHLAAALVLPTFFFTSIAVAVAAQILTTAVAIAVGSATAWATVGAALLAFGLVAAVQLTRLRRLNGVRVGGIASRVVFGTASSASTLHLLAMGAAIWAAFSDAWWLVVLCSLAGGTAYAASGARWMRAYRDAPHEHSRAESALLLAALAVPALGALVLLVAYR